MFFFFYFFYSVWFCFRAELMFETKRELKRKNRPRRKTSNCIYARTTVAADRLTPQYNSSISSSRSTYIIAVA